MFNGREKLTVTKESEIRILGLQKNLITLTEQYKIILQQIAELPQGQSQMGLSLEQELDRLQAQIRSVDRFMKHEIKHGSISPESSQLSLGKQQGGRKRSSSPTKKTEEDSVHPSTLVKKDDFLDGLGLMSQEALQMKKLQSGKVERRRRTANTNPKYSSNGFLKFDDLSIRRSKRLEAVSNDATSSSSSSNFISATPSCPPPSAMPIPSCFVCYGTDFDLSCETCTTKFHADCIRVTASNAPTPHRLPICPKCVQAANTSQRVRIQTRTSRPPPSIMQSPAKALDGQIKLEDEGTDEEDEEGQDTVFQLPTTTNPTRNSKVKRSNSTSDVEKYTSANKNNHFRNFGSSRKQIEAVSPKAKMYNGGGGQGKAVRIARVRLNMRRSSDEPKTRATVTVSAPTTPVTRSSRTPQSSPEPKQSAIRWQNKLKPRMLRTYTRRRLPVLSVASDVHICVDTPCEFCLLHNVAETRNHGNKEDEENALLISHQSVGAVCPTLKTDKVDQQSPLVIKNNNDLSYNPSPNHDTTLDSQYKVVRTSRTTSTTETTATMPTTTTTTATTNRWQKTSRKPVSKRKVNSSAPVSQEQEEEQPQPQEQNDASIIVLDSAEQQVSDSVSPLSRPKAKRRERSSKAKAEHAIVVRKTMIAMTAAAATVMSNPIKPSEEGQIQNMVIDPWENDTINQSISSVIAWANAYYDTHAEGELPGVPELGQGPPPIPITSLPQMSSSTVTCEINDEEQRDLGNENENEEEEFTPMMPPDNLSINGEADYLTSEDGNMSASSMKGQLSDEDDESEALLSVGNSPVPSWADGDTMSRSELVGKMVEKMFVEDNVMDQQQGLKSSPMAESRS